MCSDVKVEVASVLYCVRACVLEVRSVRDKVVAPKRAHVIVDSETFALCVDEVLCGCFARSERIEFGFCVSVYVHQSVVSQRSVQCSLYRIVESLCDGCDLGKARSRYGFTFFARSAHCE